MRIPGTQKKASEELGDAANVLQGDFLVVRVSVCPVRSVSAPQHMMGSNQLSLPSRLFVCLYVSDSRPREILESGRNDG